MAANLNLNIEAWNDGDPIPDEYAFCIPADTDHITMGANKSPAMSWSGAPDGTKSFAIICNDPDVPSVIDDVNQEGKIIPADLPRVDFCHWVLVDISAEITSLAIGAESDGITPGGKAHGPTDLGVRGINRYTEWFILHHYVFTVYALDVDSLGLSGTFSCRDAHETMAGHVLAEGSCTGTYTLNPDLR